MCVLYMVLWKIDTYLQRIVMCYFSTEINSVHTRNLNGILEITKKKKKTTTSILQGISTDNNVLARTSKVKETQRKLKAHEASKHEASVQRREQWRYNLHKQRKHLSAAQWLDGSYPEGHYSEQFQNSESSLWIPNKLPKLNWAHWASKMVP